MRAALLAIGAGADGIMAHLREDRRHIRDADMARLKDEISKPLNFEMAATPDMLRISLATNLLDTELPPCVGMASHRWRFARSGADGSGAVLDRDRSLGICGDWLIGPRVEAAWMSGTMLADMIRQSAGESPARHV